MNSLANINGELRVSSVAYLHPVGYTTKRLIDIVLASVAIFPLAPLLIICWVATTVTSPGTAIFRHKRVGFRGESFDCFKFRTMVVDASEQLAWLLERDPVAAAEWAANRKLRYDPRITAIGAILRRSSLDELPQLFNVLRGDMSIVGPRPVTQDELNRYAKSIPEYLSCRPGVTGLWQVSGRSSTTYRKRVACDSFYARHWSIQLDLKIIIATIPALMPSDDAC
jgi:exopolysaccharide production protein ExoY